MFVNLMTQILTTDVGLGISDKGRQSGKSLVNLWPCLLQGLHRHLKITNIFIIRFYFKSLYTNFLKNFLVKFSLVLIKHCMQNNLICCALLHLDIWPCLPVPWLQITLKGIALSHSHKIMTWAYNYKVSLRSLFMCEVYMK